MVTAPMGDLREGQDGCQVPKSLSGQGVSSILKKESGTRNKGRDPGM